MRSLALAATIAVGCGGSSSDPSDSPSVPAIVAQHTIDRLAEAHERTAVLDCQQIVQAAELFHVENGRWPASVEALVESKVLPRPMQDPWDGAYELRIHGEGVRVRSAGPDRKLDTDDDVHC